MRAERFIAANLILHSGKQQVPRLRKIVRKASDLAALGMTSFLQECFDFKEREDDASQLNRLGVAYFHVDLFPISATSYFGFAFFFVLEAEKRRRTVVSVVSNSPSF